MSEQVVKKKTCQVHENFDILAVDLSQSNNEEDVNKYLCVKCLIQKIGVKNIVLFDKSIDMIKELKCKSKKQNQDMTQERVQNIKSLQQSILEFDELIKGVISKLQNSIDEQIVEGQKEIKLRDSSIDTINLDEDIKILSSNYTENDEYEIPNQKYDTDSISSFLDSINQSLHQISTSQQFSQIYESINKIKQQFQIKLDAPDKQKNITPSLKQVCKIHESEIIMINLNQSESQQQKRFACVECIQECPDNYVSLKEINKRWIQYIQQQNEMNSNYYQKRQSKFNSATQIINQLQDKYQKTLSEIISSLSKQFKQDDSFLLIKNDYQDFNINKLDEQEIQKVVDILCLKDKHSQLKQKQEDQNQFDSIFYSNLKINLDNLMQYDILTKHNLIKILNDDEQEIIKIDDSPQNNETNNQLDPNTFLKKLLISDQYHFILNEAINFYKQLQEELDGLQQQGDAMQIFNPQQQQQSQYFQKQYQLFQSNANKIKTLVMAEDNLNVLAQLQEKVRQDTELIQSLSTNLKDQEKKYKQLNETFEKKTNEQNELLKTIQKSLEQTKSELNIKDQELNIKDQELNIKDQELNIKDQELNIKDQELNIKDQELNKNKSQNEEKLQELQCVYSFLRTSWTVGKNTILKDDYCSKILKIIEEKMKKKIKNQYLIYCGTKDGLNGQSFWKCVDTLSNLLMIFKSKSGYIFGAFSPCQWQSNYNGHVQDNTLSSFIFSQTHDQIYPLTEGCKSKAIYCNQSYGPTFGGGCDLYIQSDFNAGYSNLGYSYQWDQYKNAQSTHLFGQSTPNIAECEILMLTFG